MVCRSNNFIRKLLKRRLHEKVTRNENEVTSCAVTSDRTYVADLTSHTAGINNFIQISHINNIISHSTKDAFSTKNYATEYWRRKLRHVCLGPKSHISLNPENLS